MTPILEFWALALVLVSLFVCYAVITRLEKIVANTAELVKQGKGFRK